MKEKIIAKGNIDGNFAKVPMELYNYIQLKLISHTDLVIYIKLYDQFNLEYGYAFPTISQLQVSCGIRSKATIHNSLKNLVRVGLIDKQKTRWGNNAYFVYKPLSKDDLYTCYPNEVKSFVEFEMKEANIAALDKERFNTKPLRKA